MFFSYKKNALPILEKALVALALGAPKSTAGGTCVAEEDERIAKGEHSDPKDAQAFFGERPYIKTLCTAYKGIFVIHSYLRYFQ